MDWLRCVALLSCGLALACGDVDDPAAGGTEGEGSTGEATSGETPPGGTAVNDDAADTSGGGAEADSGGSDDSSDPSATDDGSEDDTTTGDDPPPLACQPDPARMVVLGDSIAACAGVGGINSDDCAPRLVHDYLAERFGDVTYENISVGGAVTTGVSNNQIFNIEVGQPGHVFVMIYIGGNDLAPYIFQSDEAAINGWENTTGPTVATAWEEILAFFDDETNFPDGVTLLMNTQYNPFDDCTAPPYFVSQVKIELLHAHNDALTDRAASRPWAFIADQHPVYLGHGHYVNDSNCPHYDASFEPYMNDLIHPNEPGHHNLADVMIEEMEATVYGECE
ncbi:MAG: SGNH/GDSL hydrolase family protein [Myxococcota bacterium]